MCWSLFNNVARLQDFCKRCILHRNLRFYFPLGQILKTFHQLFINYVPLENAKCKVMFTKTISNQVKR